MPVTTVNSINIHYEIRGSGPRLLYISSTGGDLRIKPSIFDSPLTSHFQVLAYDQRGFGQSDKPDAPYSMLEYASDAAGLMDALGWDKALVLGISFGGMVAQEFMLNYSHRIRQAALLCTSSGGMGGDSYPLHELSGLPVESRARRLLELSDLRWDKAWQDNNPGIFNPMLEMRRSEMQFVDDDPELKQGASRQLEARKKHDTWERLPQIQIPVGLFGGKYDGIAPPENQQNLQRQIPDASLEMFNGGHFFFLQDKSAWPAIIGFLKKAAHQP